MAHRLAQLGRKSLLMKTVSMEYKAWVNVSTRISPETKERLNKYHRQTGESIRQIIEEAIREYLEKRNH